MKSAKREEEDTKTPSPYSRTRVDKLVFVITVLWIVTSLLVLLYQPGSAHAQPHRPRHMAAVQVTHSLDTLS